MGHVSQIVRLHEPTDGLLAVTVRCCGDPVTDSVLTLHELHRSVEEIDADIAAYQARVEKLHVAKEHVKKHLARLGVSVESCECK